jgi:hypothetical protein
VYNALCEWYSRSSHVTELGDVPNDTSFDVNAAATPRGGMILGFTLTSDGNPRLSGSYLHHH